jgi:hypothetical protein
VVRLAGYWNRAKLMHDFVHYMMEATEGAFDKIKKEELDHEFMTFLSYWLSGLFVVVEGFNKLKLRDKRVQSLFKEHMQYLKALRHETYHFSLGPSPGSLDMMSQLNWAEELHDAIGQFLKQVVKRKALAERIMEIRAQTLPSRRAKSR